MNLLLFLRMWYSISFEVTLQRNWRCSHWNARVKTVT